MEIQAKFEDSNHAEMINLDRAEERSEIGAYWGEVRLELEGKESFLSDYSDLIYIDGQLIPEERLDAAGIDWEAAGGRRLDTDPNSLEAWAEDADPDELDGPYPR